MRALLCWLWRHPYLVIRQTHSHTVYLVECPYCGGLFLLDFHEKALQPWRAPTEEKRHAA